MKLLRGLGISIASLIGALLIAGLAHGQGFGAASLWKLSGIVLSPANSNWTIGSTGNRLAGVYTNTLDALSLAISSAVSGNLSVTGDITARSITVTSTSQSITAQGPSSLQTVTFTNATGTNVVLTGSVSSSALVFTNATGTGNLILSGTVSSSNAFFNYATGSKLTFNADAVASAPNIIGLDSDTGILFASTGKTITFARDGADKIQLNTNFTMQNGFDISCSSSASGCDVGTPAGSMNNVYASGTVQAGNTTSSFLAGAGTAALPAYSFIGDPDTGIYSTGANSVGVSLGGSQELSLSNLVLRPGAASGLDLGSVTVPWLNVYASGTANLDTIAVVTSTFSSTSTHNNISNTGLMATDGGVDFYSTTGTEHVAALPVTGTGNLGFLFSAVSDVSSANLFTVREAGTNRLTLNGSGLLTVGSANISTTLTSVGNTSLAAVTSSSATVDFPNLGAPGVTQDLVCYTATLGRLTHQATTCTVSSARFKENIKSMSPAEMLKKVMALRAVSFDWKPGKEPDHGINGGGKESTGFIAEEVALIDPMLVVYTDEYTPEDLAFVEKNYPGAALNKDGKKLIPKTVDYARVSVYTTGAIQAQQAQIDELRAATQKNTSLMTKIGNTLKALF